MFFEFKELARDTYGRVHAVFEKGEAVHIINGTDLSDSVYTSKESWDGLQFAAVAKNALRRVEQFNSDKSVGKAWVTDLPTLSEISNRIRSEGKEFKALVLS